MPRITINGVEAEFAPGQTILQVAQSLAERGERTEIPSYCYHDGLSIAASCRICLVEAWAPNPRSGDLEPFMGGKLIPSCQQTCIDGMVVHSDSPKAVANQKAVMEYLLINHPLDCPVCDQAGECLLQDYSYVYGRSVSRFEEEKVKNPKKDLGPHVYLYADRCIMCTRCVRFTREVAGTSELLVQGRGNREEIDVFPGRPIANELSANVIDLCPVGALLDKDFLFAQRVWFLRSTPSIDGITASGDNIFIEHNEGKIYRVKPRRNMQINTWWITDEVRYGWKFVHSPQRLRSAQVRRHGVLVDSGIARVYEVALAGMKAAAASGKRLGLLVSPMLTCEDAFLLARLARIIDPSALLGVGPVPIHGKDKAFNNNTSNANPTASLAPVEGGRRPFVLYAEKCPNSRGVRRVLESFGGDVLAYEDFLRALGHGSGTSAVGAVFLTGNYPSRWATDDLLGALAGKFIVLADTLQSPLVEKAEVLLPACTWAEKAGCFENARNMIQGFEQAIQPLEASLSEAQMALDLMRLHGAGGEFESLPPGAHAAPHNAAATRRDMASSSPELAVFVNQVSMPAAEAAQQPDMEVVEL